MSSERNSCGLLPVGTTLQMGKYRVDQQLASGGFGNTYVVTNTQFEERLAMKEFFMKGINERDENTTTVSVSNRDNHPQFEQQREKFKKEARRLRKLNNPHIVRVHDLFDENNTTYYVMDFVDGESLSNRMKRTKTPLSEVEMERIVRQVLNALEEVHEQGIWHLDLKPGNIMIDHKGNAVVIDFGASKQMDAGEGFTTTTSMCYTPGYAPTEQIDQKLERIGPWTDLYALGATIYNQLTGNKPPTVSEIQDGDAFEYPKQVSARMRRLVEWLMTVNRQHRPQSVGEVCDFLDRPFKEPVAPTIADEEEDVTVLGSSPASSKKPKNSGTLGKDRAFVSPASSAKKRPLWLVPAVAAAVVIVAVGGWLLLGGTDSEKSQLSTNAIQQAVSTETDGDKQTEEKTTMAEKMYFDSALGVCSYTGPVDENKKPNGVGKAEFTDGRVYTGPFVHGVMEGSNATFRYENGDLFMGTFKKNAFLKGRYTMKDDGSYFEGTFKDGQPGEGKWFDKNGKTM